MPKVFPSTQRFVLTYEGERGPVVTSTMYISKSDFEDMMTDVATHALRRAKLVGKTVKAHYENALGLPVLNAYPAGYTEVYR
jgi:hypothetical protein